MSDKPLLERLIYRFFGGTIDRAVNAAISVRVDDSPGWELLAGGGPHDRPWSELHSDIEDALKAWRKNFMIRRLVTLTHSYVVGGGIQITSKHPWVQPFIHAFWNHDKNHIKNRLEPMCDELTRAGELFIILYTNKIDGMSYIRLVPASQIREIKTDEGDYEKELEYGEIQKATTKLKWWISDQDPDKDPAPNQVPPAFRPDANGKLPPVMLHFAVNRPVGATRGEPDMCEAVLKWAKRYANWLEDRVRLNRTRTRQAMLDVTIADDSKVKDKRQQLRQDDPVRAGTYVHGKGEEVALHNLNLRADDAAPDGKALRLAVVTGANVALHYTGEGEAVNYSTAKEMGEPTSRFFTSRQEALTDFLIHIVKVAYKRKVAIGRARMPANNDLQLEAAVTEVARADNLALAQAALAMARALTLIRKMGWTDDRKAIKLFFKSAGEVIDEEEIDRILDALQSLPQETEVSK